VSKPPKNNTCFFVTHSVGSNHMFHFGCRLGTTNCMIWTCFQNLLEAPKKKPSSLTSTYSKERALGSSGMWGREGFWHVETYTNMLIWSSYYHLGAGERWHHPTIVPTKRQQGCPKLRVRMFSERAVAYRARGIMFSFYDILDLKKTAVENSKPI
jgi:hypothetical protein